MIHAPLSPGLKHSHTVKITRALTVPAVSSALTGFADMPPVFATAFLIGFVEWTCIDALRPFLKATEQTVGTHVDISHEAATPIGFSVTAEVTLVEVDGRKLRFAVQCCDDKDVIGRGFHERAIIDRDKFDLRLAHKASTHV